MDIEPYKYIKFTDKYVVDFISQHKNDEYMLQALQDIVLQFCKAMHNCTTSHTYKERDDMIISYIEKHFQQSANIISDKVCGQISGLVNVIHNTLNTAIADFNISKISNDVSKQIDGMLADKLYMFSDQMKYNIAQQLNEQIKNEIINPLSNNFQLLQSQIKYLANEDDLEELKSTWENNTRDICKKVNNIDRLLQIQQNESKSHRDLNNALLKSDIQNIPLLTKEALQKVLSQIEMQTHSVTLRIQQTQDHMKNINDNVIGKLDNIDKQMIVNKASNKYKGQQGEETLYNLLSDKLPFREGYKIDKVSGLSSSCDILVAREGFASIRIEVKAHGRDTNEKVRHKEVEKFQKDLMLTNCHGIFVSLYGDIVGIQNLEFIQLANGKFAAYLAKNNYDIEAIVSIIQLIQKLDAIVSKKENGSDSILISTNAIKKIQSLMKDYNTKINHVRAHLKDSLNIINDIHFDMIEKLVLNENLTQETEPVTANISETFNCQFCMRRFTSMKGKNNHLRFCELRK